MNQKDRFSMDGWKRMPSPAWSAGTSLEYLANTTATVFKEPTDQALDVLVSGRWLRLWTTDGPWQYLPSDQLPADIAKIWDERTEDGGSAEHESSR